MDVSELVAGELYLVRRRGPQLFVSDPGLAPPLSPVLHFHGHGNSEEWVAPGDVLRRADWHDVDAYLETAGYRGEGCGDRGCWCRRRARP